MTGESRREEEKGLAIVTDLLPHPPPQRSQIRSLLHALLPLPPGFHLLSAIPGNSQILLKKSSLFQHRLERWKSSALLSSKQLRKAAIKVAQLLFNRQPKSLAWINTEINQLMATKHSACGGMFLETVSWEDLFLLPSSLWQFHNTQERWLTTLLGWKVQDFTSSVNFFF